MALCEPQMSLWSKPLYLNTTMIVRRPISLESLRPCLAVLFCFLMLGACSDENDEAPTSGDVSDVSVEVSPDLSANEEMVEETNQVEPFSIELFDDIRINSVGEVNVRTVLVDFEWEGGPFQEVVLVVDLDSACFPFSEASQPPDGQLWPADCDAFDRNFELTLDPPEADGDPPGIELVRAITPFGGPMHFEIDVTDVANGLPGTHTLQCHISTWSDGSGQVTGSAGGWNVTARFEMILAEPANQTLAVIPLSNHNYVADSGQIVTTFEVPAGTTAGRIEYRVTGHGGATDNSSACIGPAEEFCQRWHNLFVDDVSWGSIQPWRDDCDELCTLTSEGASREYCAENPCGAISSVKAPRANWCPGSVTPPIIVETPALTEPGSHTFSYGVDGVVPGGSWRISAVYIALGE